MDVILLERIARLGHLGETVKVKDGYARNFLLPQGKALRANEANLAKFEAQRADLEARNNERKSAAEGLGEGLDGKSFVVVRSAGETGQLYGSVSTRDIAELVTNEGFAINKNQVELKLPIKTIGVSTVAISLHPEVEVSVTVNVARSADEAERQARGEDLTSAEAIYGEDINENAKPDDYFDPEAEFDLGDGEETEEEASEVSETAGDDAAAESAETSAEEASAEEPSSDTAGEDEAASEDEASKNT